MPAPLPLSFFAQALLIDLTDLLQDLAHTVQIGDLPSHLGDLIGMQSDLTGFFRLDSSHSGPTDDGLCH
jgi:hypothetical protein